MTALLVLHVLLTLVVVACTARVIREKREVEAVVVEAAKQIPKLVAGDPYRTAAGISLPVVRGPVYCTDCRFCYRLTDGKEGCDAIPNGRGELTLIGLKETNKNHDCRHYQEKKVSS